MVLRGASHCIDNVRRRWFPQGKLAVRECEFRGPSAFFEYHGFSALGRVEEVASEECLSGLYLETQDGIPLRLFAQIASQHPEISGFVFSSDHCAAPGLVGRIERGQFSYKMLPASSRVDSLLKAYASVRLMDLACEACSAVLAAGDVIDLAELPDAVWSRAQEFGGTWWKWGALHIDVLSLDEYLGLDANDCGCSLEEVISARHQEFLARPEFRDLIGRLCLLFFRLQAEQGRRGFDEELLADWLGAEPQGGLMAVLAKATLAGRVFGVAVKDPIGCGVVYARDICNDLIAYLDAP